MFGKRGAAPQLESRNSSSSPDATGTPSYQSTEQGADLLNGRVVIVSPHLDDAIMSLGSTIASSVQAGASVEVLTVFADVPSSAATASPWDRECGFSTEGQAASARRDEDRLACSVVGAEPRWLNFGSECYERRGTDEEIVSAVLSASHDADSVLIPGYPLAHSDHAALSQLLLCKGKGLKGKRIGLYVEQPYAFTLRKTPRSAAVASTLEPMIRGTLQWRRVRAPHTHRRTKAQAVRCYQSQLRHLGLKNVGLHRMIWGEAAQGGEAIAWL